MKRVAIYHTKMTRLCSLLGVRRYVSVGLLESLWQLTARQAPRGDIGKLSDAEIADGIDYEKDPTLLVQAMLEARWINRSARYRLVIHDWHDHAEDSVKKYLARNKYTFASLEEDVATNPEINRLPKPKPLPLPEPLPKPKTACMPAGGRAIHIPEWPATAQAIRESFTAWTGDPKIAQVISAALEVQPDLTDSQLAEVVPRAKTATQKSAGLFKLTIPEWLRTHRGEQNGHKPGEFLKCTRCGGARKETGEPVTSIPDGDRAAALGLKVCFCEMWSENGDRTKLRRVPLKALESTTT